jgi:hypothetical protein
MHRATDLGLGRPINPSFVNSGGFSAGRATRACLSVSLLAALAACASHPPSVALGPTISPQQEQAEAANYLAHAKPRYQPPGPPADPWGPYIVEASRRFDVPDTWIREVMHVESAGYQFRATGELTTSPAGAMGLMQLMPDTYDEMRGRYNLGTDAYEPHDNILAGSAYLREMYDAFGSPAFLAAYNAGPQRLQEYLVHNKPLPDETRRYVWMIGNRITGVWPTVRSPAEQLAVNQIPLNIPPGPRWVRHTTTLVAAREHKRHEAALRYAELHERDLHQKDGRQHDSRLHGHARPSVPVEVAEAPEPRPVRVAAAPRTLLHHASAFHIISPAMASERTELPGRNWGVQVGAYANRQLAVEAAGTAHGMVTKANTVVATTHSGHAVLYRARLGGMTHEAAVAACHRLAHHNGGCLLVSPASQ